MANFGTHATVGAGCGAVLALNYMATESLMPAIGLGLLCFIGSIAPDVDSKNAIITKYFFKCLGVSLGLFLCFILKPVLNFLELLPLLGLTVVLTMYIVKPIFFKFTRHRGIFHSIPMALLLALSIGYAFKVTNQYHVLFITINGYSKAFIFRIISSFFIGYMVHLTLDELYSIMGMKKSLGTAMTIFNFKKPWPYMAVWAATITIGLFIWESSYTENLMYVTSACKWVATQVQHLI
ncbi:metal-dependent hydrolase [Persicobacter psychrovividus]|uniref:Membrane protein n=1 Tax=Persicobacter psychrovividus TaxID=387638 RepID=A0ABM7VKG8_9BACT|nr:membrane protein [Persicobacter psychrovividus]